MPRDKPFELRFGMKHRGVRLYVKRVLVMEDCEEIVPEWLRFIVGVIDSDDLPLNVSREILQQSSAVRTIKKQVVKHALDALEATGRRATRRLRRGVASVRRPDQAGRRERLRIPRSARRSSSATRAPSARALHSLADYVKRMKEGQDAIYYVIGESKKALEGAPHLEGLRKRGYEVLLMTDPIDEWATESLRTFDGKPLVSAMRADLKIESTEDEKKARQVETEALRPLFERIRAVLGDRVTEVRASDRLTDSPCCLVLASAGPARIRRAPAARGRPRRAEVVTDPRAQSRAPGRAESQGARRPRRRRRGAHRRLDRGPLRSGARRRRSAHRRSGRVRAAHHVAARGGHGARR